MPQVLFVPFFRENNQELLEVQRGILFPLQLLTCLLPLAGLVLLDLLRENKLGRQNIIFKIDKKKFYRELGKKQVNVEKPHTKDEIEHF